MSYFPSLASGDSLSPVLTLHCAHVGIFSIANLEKPFLTFSSYATRTSSRSSESTTSSPTFKIKHCCSSSLIASFRRNEKGPRRRTVQSELTKRNVTNAKNLNTVLLSTCSSTIPILYLLVLLRTSYGETSSRFQLLRNRYPESSHNCRIIDITSSYTSTPYSTKTLI